MWNIDENIQFVEMKNNETWFINILFFIFSVILLKIENIHRKKSFSVILHNTMAMNMRERFCSEIHVKLIETLFISKKLMK